MQKTVRIIKPELLKQLDSVERLVAEQFILEGRWKLEDSIMYHTRSKDSQCAYGVPNASSKTIPRLTLSTGEQRRGFIPSFLPPTLYPSQYPACVGNFYFGTFEEN